ncbi:MAG: ACP S-malonyltransferase [Candidatus Eremiobacteraeota bacterium]|nr:ACP S-malonyltransferase [Candidatus Eremiobacteraeota bacterium]
MTRVGVVFPGQGSQNVGMGADVAAHFRQSRETFERAAGLLGYDLLKLQSDGPDEQLRETEYSQPAIFTTNLAIYQAAMPWLEPVVTAGHSFAEFCSLVITGALEFDDALYIVNERGKAMQDAAQRARGGMSAVLGLEAARVEEVLREQHLARVSLANFNSPTQIVISGDLGEVQAAGPPMLEAGAKRVVPLNVSGAWHSALMEPAVERLAAAVRSRAFALPRFDVISNVDGRAYRDVETIKANLIRSIVDEVRWHATALQLLEYDLELIVEFGASAVLGPLMRRIQGAPPVMAVTDGTGIARLRETIERGASVKV